LKTTDYFKNYIIKINMDFNPIPPAKVKMGFTADIISPGRSRIELPKKVELPFDPTGTLAYFLFDGSIVGPHGCLYNHRLVGMNRYFHGFSIHKKQLEADGFPTEKDCAV